MTVLVIVTLSFFSLATITFATQNAQAATAPLCGPASGSAGPVTATTVIYGGKKFDIIGYNKNGNEVGVAGPNNSVTLLLDKDDADLTQEQFNSSATNTYQASKISTYMSNFANSILSTNVGIIERTLTGESNSYGYAGYNEDFVSGPNVTNQKSWALSVDEATHLILSNRVFVTSPTRYWLRTPGIDRFSIAYVSGTTGNIVPDGTDASLYILYRPALYLDISSTVFNSMDFRQGSFLPIGACAPQPNNLGIDYVAETVTGLDTDVPGWSLSDSPTGLAAPSVQVAGSLDISSNISNTASNLYYYKASMNTDIYFDSNTDSNGVVKDSKSKLIIPARPSGPSVTGVMPSAIGASDGKITGTSNKMEYSTDEATWTSVTGAAITGLTSGTYFVRTIADQSTSRFKSFAKEVIVKEWSPEPPSEPTAGPGSGTGPNTGDGDSTVGTAQTGIDFTGLELLFLIMLICGFGFHRKFTNKFGSLHT